MLKQLVFSATLAATAQVATAADQSLIGVWQIEIVQPSNGKVTKPLQNLVIFTQQHYSMVRILGNEAPQKFEKPWTPTDTEKISRYDSLIVNTGRYVVSDGEIQMTPSVARVPEFIGGSFTFDYHVSDDGLMLISKDEYSFDGVQAPWAKQGLTTTLTLQRVE
jgi:hypothetical protein